MQVVMPGQWAWAGCRRCVHLEGGFVQHRREILQTPTIIKLVEYDDLRATGQGHTEQQQAVVY